MLDLARLSMNSSHDLTLYSSLSMKYEASTHGINADVALLRFDLDVGTATFEAA